MERHRIRRVIAARRRLIRRASMMGNGTKHDTEALRWSVRAHKVRADCHAKRGAAWRMARMAEAMHAHAAGTRLEARGGLKRVEARDGRLSKKRRLRKPRMAPATPRRDALSPRCAHPRLFLSHVPDAPTTAQYRVRRPPRPPAQLPTRRRQQSAFWRRATPPWLPLRPLRRPPLPGPTISSPQGARRRPRPCLMAYQIQTATTGRDLRKRSRQEPI